MKKAESVSCCFTGDLIKLFGWITILLAVIVVILISYIIYIMFNEYKKKKNYQSMD